MENENHGDWYYQQIDLGYNYRMTELQAALGVSQMKRLDDFILMRHLLAARYNRLLRSLPVVLPYQMENTYSGLHLYVIRLKLDRITLTHKEVFDALRENSIVVNLHYIPVHTQPYYRKMGFGIGDFPESERYYTEAISLPMFQGMTEKQQDAVVSVLTQVLQERE
jgi:dTDP-4-amino-4,6-dideoxygalactose transaminase